ncbi:MAG: penicillin-binding protein 1C [Sphingobacteriales bacterium]|nr:MAG: penicillin-binding protein 1C [Sphingobacteriales bacterium]
MRKRWATYSKARKAFAIVFATVALFFLFDIILPVNTHVVYTPVITSRSGSILHAYLTSDQQWRMNTRLDEITPELRDAIIFKEDKHFYRHFGINPLAIGRAAINNIFRLKRTSGASTITMQVARMLVPKRRTYLNKLVEMFRAMQIELHYSKDEILQMYLNLVPYGSNIQGVKAASVLYFDKSPNQLSLAELTALSIIPNRPNSLVMGKDNALIVKERNKWLLRFKKAGIFRNNIIHDALQEPLTAYRHNAPAAIPQLALRMRYAYPQAGTIHTTIDAGMQAKVEELVANYTGTLRLHGINNAAVLVVDNKTHNVLTYIGSPDFNDRVHNGQVDGVVAVRSPGSTLKPLLYALAFDAGMATPKTMITDVPVNIKGYMPENYDLSFHGNVSVEYSLCNSLNIPAVKVLDKLGTPAFVGALSKSGFISVWQNRKKVGLSMILGGCGVRLDELTGLYSCFANNGNFYPLQYTIAQPDKKTVVQDTSKRSGVQIITPESAYMLTDILSQLHRPDLPNLSDLAQSLPRIAWKTGTSYGRKDAWSVGYNQRYTIGVWIGNFNAVGVPELSGAGVATPLLFQLFNSIDRNSHSEWLRPPAGLAYRFVCSQTGALPGDFCEDQVMDAYIPGISSNHRCSHLKEVYITADEKYSYCTSCMPVNGYKIKTYPNIPPELSVYYEINNIPYTKVPMHNPACNRMFDGQAPVINSLSNGSTYIVADKQQQLQLSCMVGNDVQQVYWYINDKFYSANAAAEKTFFTPTTPLVKISCTDDKGRTTNLNVKVKYM